MGLGADQFAGLDKTVQRSLPGGGEEPSALDVLAALGRNQCQLKHDADRCAVAIIPMPSQQEVWRVYSTGFEEWLRTAYWRDKEMADADTTMKSALATLAAAGINDDEEVEVHVRRTGWRWRPDRSVRRVLACRPSHTSRLAGARSLAGTL